MDKEALKKSVNLNLRCVTQSCKGGVPLNRLEKDYKDLIGKPIPINDLGFNSIELFLRSIPDVVCLKRNDGLIIVEGVADASTQHIANLISRQKSSRTGKSISKKPSLQIRKYSCHESWKSSATNSAGAHKQVNKTSVSHPVKLKMPALQKAEFTHSAPQKVGTNTKASNEALVHLPNIAIEDSTLNTKQRARRRRKLRKAAKQRARRRRKLRKAAQLLINSSELSLSESQLQKKVLKAQELSMTTEEFIEWLKKSHSTLTTLNSSTLTKNQDSAKYNIQEVPSTSNESISHASQNGWETSSNSSSNTSTVLPALDLKKSVEHPLKRVQSVLSSNDPKSSILPSPVKITKPVLPTFSQAMPSAPESSSTLTTINSSTLTEKQDLAKNTEQLSKENQKLKSLTLRNLWNVAFRFEGGVRMCHLPKEYKTLFGTSIPYKELGYKTLKAFILDIPEVLRLKKEEKEHEYTAEAVRDTILQTSRVASQPKKDPSTSSPSINYASHSAQGTSSNSSSSASKTVPEPNLKVSIENSLKSIQSVLSTYDTIESIIPPPVIKTKPVLPAFSQAASSEFVPSIELNLSKLESKPTLNSFPKIKHSIASAQFNSLLLMNILLYGDDSFMAILKRGILAFDGFRFSEDSDEWKQKQLLLSMMPEDTLKECLKLLCIECDSNNKQVLIYKLMQFLSSPNKALSERK